MFDLHVHAAPCVAPRWGDDTATVGAYEEAGFTGCVLKGHCEPTVGRAAAAGAGRSLAVFGGVVLNAPVGGLNPAAVEAALATGGRVVWMPTVDAAAHRKAGITHPPPCAPRSFPGPSGRPLAIPPVNPAAESVVHAILRLVADADATIATGHLGYAEIDWLVDTARQLGIQRVLLTHPGFTVPALTADHVRELCDRGATAEITAYQWQRQHHGDIAALAAFVTTVGPRRCVLSSDAGQADSPPPPQALTDLVDALIGTGLDPGEVRAMASDQPAALIGA